MKKDHVQHIVCGVCGKRIYTGKMAICNHDKPMYKPEMRKGRNVNELN